MYTSILVAFDRSDHAGEAIKAACALAKAFDAKLHVITAPQLVGEAVIAGYSAVSMPPNFDDVQASGEKACKLALEQCAACGVSDAITHIGHGDPAQEIVSYASENDIDLIVMGRRGLGQLTGLLVGSVTTKVGQLAQCAVLTVK
ncbi:MAG: universal stress protein [Pseudomonadota bacterium]